MAYRLIVLLTGLLVAGAAQAVDEDYYIPYTDTYGYVYDPETGKFVKQEPAPAAGQDDAAGDETKATGEVQASRAATPDEANEPMENESASSVPFLWISGGIILIAGYLYRLRQKRRDAVPD